MKLYRSILGIELKRMITVMNIILLSVFFIIAMYYIQDGISKYKGILKDIEDTRKIEHQKVEKYINYEYYGINGFRVIPLPPPVSIFFFNSGVGTDLQAYLNLGERLNIETSLKGKNLVKEQYAGFTDFSGLFILFGSLLCFFYGFKSFDSREYLKMLACLKGEKKIYFHIIGARFTLIALLFIITMLSGILLALVNGIALPGSDYILLLKFSMAILLALFIFFIIGTTIGTLKSPKYSAVLLMAIWVGFVLFIPIAVSKISNRNAQSMPSNVRVELDNWTSLWKFEQRMVKEFGKYSKEKAQINEIIAKVSSLLTTEYKEIQAAEKRIEEGMKDNSRVYHLISSFTPGTFLLSMTNELSGYGYNNVIELFKCTESMKDDFWKFFIEKEYPPTDKKVESFIKGDENVYKSVSRVPGTYWPGMGIMAVYALLLTWLGAHRFDKYLYYVQAKTQLYKGETKAEEKNKMLTLKLQRGEYYFLKREQDRLRDYLYAVFNGKLDHKTKQMMNVGVLLNETDITSNPVKHNFLYVCSPENVPDDIRVNDFVKLMSCLLDLSKEEIETININAIKNKLLGDIIEAERFKLLLNLIGLVKKEIILVDKSEKGMRPEVYIQLKTIMERLTAQKALALYLFEHIIERNPENYENFDFNDDSKNWKYLIKLLEEKSTGAK